MRNQRGEVLTTVLVLTALAGVPLFGNTLHLPAFLVKEPKTKELSQAQKDLADAKRKQAEAEAKLADAEARRDAIKEKQLDFTQQMVAGAKKTLDSMPATEKTAAVKVAHEFVDRADAGFIAARGALSPEAQAEINKLYDAVMAAKDNELATLRTALDTSNRERAQMAEDKAKLAAEIPALKATVVTAEAKVEVIQVKNDGLVAKVADYADGKAASDKEAGSWQAYFWIAVRIGVGLAILYGIVHFMLPSLQQEYPGSRVLTWMNKTAKSLTSAHQ